MKQSDFIKQQKQRTMHLVCKYIKISPDDYMQHLKRAGIKWLLEYLKDKEVVDNVIRCDVFWKWWYLQAYYRDNDWLENNTITLTESNRMLNDWLYYHGVQRLCDRSIKHAQLLFSGYANINWNRPNPKRKKQVDPLVIATGLQNYNYN